MASLTFHGACVERQSDESALDALLRAGCAVPHSCRAGACHTCLLRCTRGSPAPEAQRGLDPRQVADGLVLACQFRPEADVALELPERATPAVPARILTIEPLSASVVRVLIGCPPGFRARPGQFIRVIRSDGLARPYSLAGDPAVDGWLELHVRRVPEGRMSGWFHDRAARGERVRIAGPLGSCVYDPSDRSRGLLLAGTGTGLAPLLGIARDALARGHSGPIRLHHGAVEASGLYLVDELVAMGGRYANFEYHACVLNAGDGVGVGSQCPLDQAVREAFPSPAGWSIYLCGDPDLVGRMRKQMFLAGASLGDIHTDPFVAAA